MKILIKLKWKRNLIFLLIILTILNCDGTCPDVCTCKWKGGKRRIECTNQHLMSFLPDMDSDTQVLDYSHNYLQIIPNDIFQKTNLINIQKLYISNCQISTIYENTFRGLANLIELDISKNKLTELPSNTFKHYPLLMKLIISDNPIRNLRKLCFQPLHQLITIDLSNCLIQNIHKDSFKGLHKLEWLKLHHNRLSNIDSYDTLPSVSSGISLHQNLWTCDCKLREFLKWILTSNTPITSELICSYPSKFKGTVIKHISNHDLACIPNVTPSTLYLEIQEGKNISFICQVNAIPEANLYWEFQGKTITPTDNNSSIINPFLKYNPEDGTTEKISELVVLNSRIENAGTYRCVAENPAGVSSSNYTVKIIQKVTTSRKIENEKNSYIYILISSIATLIALLTITVIIFCLFYYQKWNKKRKMKKQLKCKYVIANNHEEQDKIEMNPDLIVNTQSSETIIETENPDIFKQSHIYTNHNYDTELFTLYQQCNCNQIHENCTLLLYDQDCILPDNFNDLKLCSINHLPESRKQNIFRDFGISVNKTDDPQSVLTYASVATPILSPPDPFKTSIDDYDLEQ